MRKHQVVAIILGIIMVGVSFIPVYIVASRPYVDLAHPSNIKVFMYPTIGVAVAAVIIFISFFKDSKDE